LLGERLKRHSGGCAGRKAVVDKDDRPPCGVGRCGAGAVQGLAPFDLGKLALADRVEHAIADAEARDQAFVTKHRRRGSVNDRPHGQFLMSRHADLAHHEDIERGSQGLRDFRPHDHAAARQGEDDRGFITVAQETLRQLAAGICPVGENHGITLPNLSGLEE